MVRELKKYIRYVKNQLFQRGKLNFLILYVTSNCNFKCRTCFFHANLNQNNDLSFEEFEKISKNLGRVSILLLSGGEPFLRPDLLEICALFIKNNSPDILYIPTNGFFTEKILDTTESLLKKFPELILSVNPSLDGFAASHDWARGVEGSFDRAMKTIKELVELKKRYPNLQVIVNSVIHQENIPDLKKLAIYLRDFAIDWHAFEILRGESRSSDLKQANAEEIKNMHEFILENRRWYLARSEERGWGVWINRFISLGQLAFTQRLKERVLAGAKWPFLCVAGKDIAAIYPNGDIGQCELLAPVGNIRNYGYDLKKLLGAAVAVNQRAAIKENRCSCTHICFINSSLSRDWWSIIKLPFLSFKKR